MYLTPDTDPDRLSRLALPDRRSAENRRELERLANICTPRSVDVSVSFTEREASCRPADTDDTDDGAGGTEPHRRRRGAGGSLVTESYVIRLPTERIEQGRTEMHPRRWDRRVQVGLLFHELGHVLYSDLQRFGEWRSHITPEWEELFRTVYNAAEDGVVEAQMAAEFDVREDFVVLNDAFAQRELRRHRAYVDLFDDEGAAEAGADPDDERPREPSAGGASTAGPPAPTPGPGTAGTVRADGPPLEYTVKEALGIGLLDHGFGDSGRFEALLDPADDRLVVRNDRHDVLAELRPAIEEYMDRMFAEPDGTRRVDLAAAFFRTVRPALEPLPPAQLGAGQRRAARPRDAVPVAITDPRPADSLPGLDGGAEEDVAGRRGRDYGPTSQGSVLPGRLDQGTVRRAERALRGDDSRRALDGDSDPLRREAERLLELVSDSEDLDRVGIPEPEPGSGDRERWEAAARDAQRLSAALETQLRHERRATRSGGHRVGSLDSRRVVDVRRGSSRVFERVERGPEKDYSCLLVLDRSGSMSGTVTAAEDATARLAVAMTGVGVDVSVLSVYRSLPWLELPFGGSPGDHVDRLLSGRVGGSTPLSAALTIARERVRTGRGHEPLVFVVTDGAPNSEGRYKAVLDACNFPVFGVYVSEGDGAAPDHADFFDRLVVTDPDAVGTTLTRLVRTLFRRG